MQTAQEAAPSAPRPTTFPDRFARLLPVVALIGIAIVSLALRWDRLAYAEFGSDQAWSINRAYDFVTKGDFPLVGIRSSVGSSQGAIEIYLLSLPVAFSPDPALATAFVGLLQTLAVVGTYFLVARHFGRPAGLIAAALYAVNPWAAHYGRKIWTQDMIPLFSFLLLASVYGAVVQRRRFQMAWACALLAVLFLLHPTSLIFAPFVGVVVLLFWRRIGPLPLLLGAALALVVMAPFLYHEYLHGFPSLLVYSGVVGGQSVIDLQSLQAATALASATYFPAMMGYWFWGEWHLPDLALQAGIATLLLYLGLAICLWRVYESLRGRRQAAKAGWEAYLLLFLWFCLPVLAAVRHSFGLHAHNLLGIYPGQFALIALALTQSADLLGRAGARFGVGLRRPALLAVVLVVLYMGVSQVLFFRHYLDLVEYNGPSGPYGVPLLYSQQAVDTVRSLQAELGTEHVYVGSYSQWEVLSYLGRPDLQLRRFDPQADVILPSDPTAGALVVLAADDGGPDDRRFLLTDDEGAAIRHLRQAGFDELVQNAIRAQDGHAYYRFFWLEPRAGTPVEGSSEVGLPPSFKEAPEPTVLASGLRLLGYALPAAARPGETVTLALLWSLPPDLADYRDLAREFVVFSHAVDHGGRVVGNYESEFLRDEYWRGGDCLVTYHQHEIAADGGPGLAGGVAPSVLSSDEPGLLWFDLGAYRRVDHEDIPWLDDGGAPGGQASKLGPLKVSPPATAPPPQVATDFRFGESLELQGYSLAPGEPVAGQKLTVALHWQARSRPDGDYTVSVQVLDGAGRLVAQHDGPPVQGNYPTGYWEEGEVVIDPHELELPADLAPGTYSLVVVVYEPTTHARLPVLSAAGIPAGDSAPVGSIEVKPARR